MSTSPHRILREALSQIAKLRVREPTASRLALTALRNFAETVRPYCQHPEYVFIEIEMAHACLDCGLRFQIPPEVQLPLSEGPVWPDSSGV